MTEVCNCGGGHRTRLREDLVYLWGAPSHIYIGGGEVAGPRGRAKGGVLLGLPVQVVFGPLLSFPEKGEGKEVEEKKERASAPQP